MTTTTPRKPPSPRRPAAPKLPVGWNGGITIPEPVTVIDTEWTDEHAARSPIGAALAKEWVAAHKD